MAFRRGTRRLVDPLAGPLALTGDGFAAAGELVTLVVTPEVQRFLEMTPAEIDAARRAVEAYRAALTALHADAAPAGPDPRDTRDAARHASAALQAIVGGNRFTRLRALSWRVLGGDALLDDDVATLLELSPEQRAALASLAQANEQQTADAFKEYSRARLASVDDLHARIAADDAARSRSLLDRLTPAQRLRFEQLQAGTATSAGPGADDDQPR